MDRPPLLQPARRADDPPKVLLRLYTSGHSEYTQSVVESVRDLSHRYNPEEVVVQVRDAIDADEDERIFFTPMLIVVDAREPDRRTIVVGDLRAASLLNTLLADHGIRPAPLRSVQES